MCAFCVHVCRLPCVVVFCVSRVVWFVPNDDQEKHQKEIPKIIENRIKFKKRYVKWVSWSTSERLLQHREASQGLGMALETYKARVRSAIQRQKSLPESRRVAPGTPHGHFLKALGRHFLEKRSNNADFYRLECSISIFHRNVIDFSRFFE